MIRVLSLASFLSLSACSFYFEEPVGSTDTPDAPDAFVGREAIGDLRWSISLGGTRTDYGVAAAFDSVGDVVAAGVFKSTFDAGGGIMSPPDQDSTATFLTKRSGADGAHVWTRALNGRAGIQRIAIAPDDTILVLGDYNGTIDFGGQSLTVAENVSDVFLARYESDGSLLWVQGLGGASASQVGDITIDPDGNVFIVGAFQGAVDFGDRVVTVPDGYETDVFVLSFTLDGELRWGFADPADGWHYAHRVEVLSDGGIVVIGSMSHPASLGGDVVDPQAYWGSFVARYTSAGEHVWSRRLGPIGGEARSSVSALAVGADDTIFLSATHTADFQSSDQIVLQALDPAGAELWSRPFQARLMATALVDTPSGDLLSASRNDGSPFDYAGSHLERTLVIAAHDLTGAPLDAASYGDLVSAADEARPTDLDISPTGALVVTGEYSGWVDYGGTPHRSAGVEDMTLAVFNAAP